MADHESTQDVFARLDRSVNAAGGQWGGEAEDHVVHPGSPSWARWEPFSEAELRALEEATNIHKDEHGDRLPALYVLHEQVVAELRRRGAADG